MIRCVIVAARYTTPESKHNFQRLTCLLGKTTRFYISPTSEGTDHALPELSTVEYVVQAFFMGSHMSDTAAAILHSTAEEKLVQQKTIILFPHSAGLKIRSESKIGKNYGIK